MSDPIPTPDVPKALEKELVQIHEEKDFRLSQYTASAALKYLERIKPKVKDIKGFWPFVLTQHVELASVITSSSDRQALSYLTDIELKQDPKDPRPFEVIFHFSENPFFSNTTLSKKYTLIPGKEAPADGSITEAMRKFDPRADVVPDAVKIEWKSPDKDLCAKHPRIQAQPHDHDAPGHNHDDEDYEGDVGSFFWYFADAVDPYDIGTILSQDILPEAYGYITGQASACIRDEEDSEDDDDELDEEDGDDDEEIDLEDEEEQPSKKKRRTAGQ